MTTSTHSHPTGRHTVHQTAKVSAQTGCLVYVMGPSGAGKDAVIYETHKKLNENRYLYFSRRYVTRAVSDLQEISLSVEEFTNYKRNGLFALNWEAHGLNYGVSKIIDSHLANGKTVVVNGSRAYLREALIRYPSLLAVQITAPRDLIRARLIARRRESAEAIEARLSRSPAFDTPPSWLVNIDNSGTLEQSVSAFTALLLNECVCNPG